MGDRPAQPGQRRLGIDALEHIEQMVHRTVVVPVEGRGHAARDSPAQHVVELDLLRLARRTISIELSTVGGHSETIIGCRDQDQPNAPWNNVGFAGLRCQRERA